MKYSPGLSEILHKETFIFKTPIVKIGVFSFLMQLDGKKVADTSCIFTMILLQCVHPKILPREDICL